MDRLYISVIGAGDCSAAQSALAEQVGTLLAQSHAILVCGALGGVMEAAARGAKAAGGTTIGILPGHERAAANPYIDHAITTGVGHARNLAVVSTGDAVIAVGGGYGTLSEIGLAAKIGRPVVLLGSWRLNERDDLASLAYATSAQEAVEMALEMAVETAKAAGR